MMNFIKELKEARLIRAETDVRYSYTDVCENLYLVLLTLEFLHRTKQGKQFAQSYAGKSAAYILYNEFRVNATDLYNLIYLVQASPERIEKIFKNEDSRSLREKTHLPVLQINRYLLNLASEDIYFFMRLEQLLGIKNTDYKEIRRLLSFKNPSNSDLVNISARIMNAIRYKMPTLDIRQEIENILSSKKYDYIS